METVELTVIRAELSEEVRTFMATQLTDIDAIVTPGLYGTSSQATTAGTFPPGTWNYCLLEVFQRHTVVFQRITSHEPINVAVRTKVNSGGWSSWKVC